MLPKFAYLAVIILNVNAHVSACLHANGDMQAICQLAALYRIRFCKLALLDVSFFSLGFLLLKSLAIVWNPPFVFSRI